MIIITIAVFGLFLAIYSAVVLMCVHLEGTASTVLSMPISEFILKVLTWDYSFLASVAPIRFFLAIIFFVLAGNMVLFLDEKIWRKDVSDKKQSQ